MTPARLTDVTESDGCNGSKGKRLFPFLSVTSVAFCFSLLLFILAVPVFSQVPGVINYQGSLRDKSGNPINQSLPMTFSIYDTPATGTGTQLWTENQTVGVNNGVFSVHVGAVNPIPESVFASSSAYLEVDINGEAPSARPQLLSSPYSFHSSAADYALTVSSSIAVSTINATASTPFGGVNITTNAFIQGNVGIGTTNPQASLDIESGLLHVSGSPSPATPAQGAWIGWNALTGQPGETDFINNEGLGGGGFAFINTSSAGVHLSTPMFIAGSGNVGISSVPAAGNLFVVGAGTLTVAQSGNISTPARSSVHVTDTASALSVPNVTFTKVPYGGSGNLIEDAQGEYDPNTNYRFTAKTAGDYEVCASLYSGFSNEEDIYLNGARDYAFVGSAGDSSGCTVINLASGDYIEIWIYQNTGSAQTLNTNIYWNWLTITKLN